MASVAGRSRAERAGLAVAARGEVVDAEQLEQTRYFEHAPYAVRRLAQHELRSLCFEALLGLHEQADAGRVDEVDRRQVQSDAWRAVMRESEEDASQFTRGAVFEFAGG